MRIAVLGAGAMGAVHAAAYAHTDDVELAAIVGRTDARVRGLAAAFGARASTDPRAVLDDPTIDAVDITLPTRLHREFAVAALERGKHVFCETPLAPTVDDAGAMIEAARRHGRLLQVALLQRVADLTVHVRDLLRAGALGRPRLVSSERLWPGLDADPTDHHGDALEELALFDFDYLVWCFGMPRGVSASAPAGARVDHVVVVLDFADVMAVVETSARLPATFQFRITTRIVCERGALEWTLRFPTPDGRPVVSATRYPVAGTAEPLPVGERNPYEIECRHFVRVARGEADPTLLGAEAARDGLRILAAARESLARGGRVALG